MTLEQLKHRFPQLPDNILIWALENIDDEYKREKGLSNLQQGRGQVEEVELVPVMAHPDL